MLKVRCPDFSSNRIQLEGAYNVREVGGYSTRDGRFTKPGILFRADSLHALTLADQQTINNLGIGTIIDLRHPQETRRYPNIFAQSEFINYLNIPFYHGWRDLFPQGQRPRSLTELYTTILDNCHETIWQVLTAVANPQNYPLLVHCQVGKDRTGMLIALLLWAVNVPEEVIVADYALSSSYLQPILNDYRQQATARGYHQRYFQQLLKSPPKAMQNTLHHLHHKYSSVTNYLRIVGLDEDQLRTLRHILVFP